MEYVEVSKSAYDEVANILDQTRLRTGQRAYDGRPVDPGSLRDICNAMEAAQRILFQGTKQKDAK